MRLIKKIIIFAAFIVPPSVSEAQSLPNTQVYCFDLERSGERFNIGNAKFLTGYNPYGYNNQPQWVNNFELYLSVQTPEDTTQTEIFSLSLLTNTLARVTATAEAEYSPTLMPDRRHISCVRVDASPTATQRLWSYPIDRSDAGKDLLPLHIDIGYHTWVTDKKLALFVLNGNSNYLKIVNTEDQSSIQLTNSIGRSLAKTANGQLAFIQKATAQTWYIKTMNLETYTSEIVIQTLPGAEDFVLLPDGTFLMGSGSKLYMYKLGNPLKEWIEVADLKEYGLINIKRLAVNRDISKIAIVNDLGRRQ